MPTHKFFDMKRALPHLQVVWYLISCAQAEYSFIEKEISFETVGCIPIVKGTINGKSTFFIIDTGASITMLNESDADHFGFRSHADERQHLVGFGGVSRFYS